MTPLMANVAESMAIDLSCRVVVEDFDREFVSGLYRDFPEAVPGGIASDTRALPGTVQDMSNFVDHTVEVPVRVVAGPQGYSCMI